MKSKANNLEKQLNETTHKPVLYESLVKALHSLFLMNRNKVLGTGQVPGKNVPSDHLKHPGTLPLDSCGTTLMFGFLVTSVNHTW